MRKWLSLTSNMFTSCYNSVVDVEQHLNESEKSSELASDYLLVDIEEMIEECDGET